MKLYFTFFACLFAILAGFGQCPDCTPDESCIPEVAFPALCPEVLPDATAGEYYETTVTFYMPAELEDPESGFVVSLEIIQITNVLGLPYGLSFELSGDDNFFYPSQGEQFGCASICGTPLLAGLYNVTVYVNATVTVFGTTQSITESFSVPLTVLQGEGGTGSFTYSNLASCDSLEVSFEALINAAPSLTTWQWDFGNGNTSNLQIPAVQQYNTPGEYTVSLQTTITNYLLESVNVTGLWNNWSSDADDFFGLGNPDPFFVLIDGNSNVVYTAATVDGVNSASWSGLNYWLTNPPYSISFYDEDLITENDSLGTIPVDFNPGAQSFNTNGTQGILSVIAQTGDQFYDEQVFTVFPDPTTEFLVDEENGVLYYDDPLLEEFIWFFNGDTIPNAIDSALVMVEPGVYSCLVANEFGCTGFSSAYTLCPELNLVYDPFDESLSVAAGFASYSWEFNGLPLQGETGNSIDASTPGNYSVTITTSYGCEVESSVYTITVGLDEPGAANITVFPNPSQGLFRISVGGEPLRYGQWQALDRIGRICAAGTTGPDGTADMSNCAPGMYLLQTGFEQGTVNVFRVVVE